MIEDAVFTSKMGLIEIRLVDHAVVSIQWADDKSPTRTISSEAEIVRNEIVEFVEGIRKEFTFVVQIEGSPFMRRVLTEMYKIPYGQVVSYSELARLSGNPKAIRATASVCRKNPLPLVIPCHRVIHKNGDLGNYAGGLDRKKQLLEMERRSQ